MLCVLAGKPIPFANSAYGLWGGQTDVSVKMTGVGRILSRYRRKGGRKGEWGEKRGKWEGGKGRKFTS